MHPFFRFLLLVPALALALVFSGCGGEHERNPEPHVPLGPDGKPVPIMTAKDTFDNGRLVAEITLSRARGRGGFRPSALPGLPSASDYDDDDDGPKITPEMIEAMRTRRSESPLLPMMLRLKLTSAAKDMLNVEILDFESDLGNFVVQPDHVALDPGQSVEPDPMISRLGVTSTEIPVTIALRINGQVEKRVLTLHPVPNENQAALP